MSSYQDKTEGFEKEEITGLAGDEPPETPQGGEIQNQLDETAAVIEALRRERDEYYDLLLRKQAEFENYRKRVNREREEDRAAAFAEILREILPVLDAGEKGLEKLRESAGPDSPYVEGFELLLRTLRGLLEKYGVREVPGVGADFDPTVHEAVVREISDRTEENQVVEEYRKGYLIGERLLRPAQVKVSVRPE